MEKTTHFLKALGVLLLILISAGLLFDIMLNGVILGLLLTAKVFALFLLFFIPLVIIYKKTNKFERVF